MTGLDYVAARHLPNGEQRLCACVLCLLRWLMAVCS